MNLPRKKNLITTSIISGLALYAPFYASAETPEAVKPSLEVITVTAQKREQSLDEVPISMQVVYGDLLEKQNIIDMKGLVERLPNVHLGTTPGPSSISIRGVGTGSTNSAAEQAVGIYVDGLYVSRGHQFNSPFTDIERVEVLKGPQGVLQGKNSVAGAVVITSRRPTDKFEASLRAGYEIENQGYNLEGIVSGPLTENLSARLVAQTNLTGGWIDTSSRTSFDGTTQLLGKEDQNEDEFYLVRTSLLWEPSEEFSLFGKVEVGKRETRGVHFGPNNIQPSATGDAILALFQNRDPNFGFIGDGVISNGFASRLNSTGDAFEITNDEMGLKVESTSLTGQADWTKEWGTVTSITTYSEFDHSELFANSMAPLDWVTFSGAEGEGGEEFNQTTQEFRLVSPGNETIDYIVGGFYQDRTIKLDGRQSRVNVTGSGLPALDFFTGLPVEVAPGVVVPINVQPFLNAIGMHIFEEDTQAVSLFGQVTWNVSDDVRINVGARYTDETKEVNFDRRSDPLIESPFNPIISAVFGTQEFTTADLPVSKISDSNFDPSASVQWDISDDVMLYASYTKATKGGGFNSSASRIDNTSFRPEKVTGIETGFKGTYLDGQLMTNVAFYQSSYDDLQVSALDSVTNSFFFKNAAEATTQGLEADFRYAASENIEVGGAIAYLDATYDDFPGASCAAGLSREADCSDNNDRNAKGDTLRFAPEVTGSFYADYEIDLSNDMIFNMRGDVIYSDEFNWGGQNDPFQAQDSFTKLDLAISLTSADENWKLSIVGRNVTDETTFSFGGGVSFYPEASWSGVDAPRQIFINAEYKWF